MKRDTIRGNVEREEGGRNERNVWRMADMGSSRDLSEDQDIGGIIDCAHCIIGFIITHLYHRRCAGSLNRSEGGGVSRVEA